MLTGISLGQGFAYVQWFPDERRLLKTVVLSIIIVDVVQTSMTLGVAWWQFISCRRNLSYACTVENTWQSLVAVPTAGLVTIGVQMFYCYRVWIVSGKNRIVAGSVAILAGIQLILGATCSGFMITIGTVDILFTNPYLPTSYGASALCDIIITVSMIYYLREGRTGIKRSGNRLKRMMVLFVHMGLLTSLAAVSISLSYVSKGALWLAVPGEVIPKLYVNSMLAVLNARKTICRDNEESEPTPEIVVPTIRIDP
ncbi:hypothetical protein OG21DRAFT_1507159 [Imleria badia]|nr:hypothetical protein OG21DRAFT_1507159 [Imleria badia]